MKSVPGITGEAMARVDRIMIDEYGIDLHQIMETAGYAVAACARDECFPDGIAGKRVRLLCGVGGNGGDGLVAARYLHAWGADVSVIQAYEPDPARGAAAHQLAILRRMGIPVATSWQGEALPNADLVIDALLGFGLSGPPGGAYADLIQAVNHQSAPVLAVDLPSGLGATGGEIFEPCIRAHTTLTLGLPKTGLLLASEAIAGRIFVADIGIPASVFHRFGIEVEELFARESRLRLG